MNELKLSLQNFQSISEGELIFRTGLNFIVGQSNSGKSATFRALKACLLNPKGSQRFIKKGHSKSTVTLYYNGNEIEWNRTSKESSYIINKEEYIKTGSSDSFRILENNTGFVRDEKEGALMNIEEELQLPFPFGISKADLFKLFENVFCVSDSALILKSAKEHEDSVKDKIASLDLEKSKLELKINSLHEFREEINLKKLKEFKSVLEEKQARLNLLNDGLVEIKQAKKIEDEKLEVEEREFEDMISPYLKALECKKALIAAKRLHNLSKSLQGLPLTFENRISTYNELNNLRKEIIKLKGLSTIVLKDKTFTSKLEKYNSLKEVKKTLQIAKKLNKVVVHEITFEDKLKELEGLKSVKTNLEILKKEIKDLQANKKREEENVVRIEAKLKEFKVCPLCHHSLEE